ncbi:MAG: redoxin domain-containing protein [Planctomycetota bacterium]
MSSTRFAVTLLAATMSAGVLVPASVARAQEAVEATNAVMRVAPGERMPPLTGLNWVQGKKSETFESGTIYVLDFWSTWCGPCIAAMPHMNDLQAKYADQNVEVIGVHIWQRDNMDRPGPWLEKRVQASDARMPYPKFAVVEDVNDRAATTYMRALGLNGIPTTMIVDREGRLAWFGHPMAGMDQALEQMVAGTYDLNAWAAEYRNAAKAEEAMQRATAAMQSGDAQAFVDAVNNAVELMPGKYAGVVPSAYGALLMTLEADEMASEFLGAHIDGVLAEQPDALDNVAWGIATQLPPEKQDLELALKAAKKAVAVTKGENANFLDTLGAVYFAMGDRENAIEHAKRAIELEQDGAAKAEYQSRLDEYEGSEG